MCCIMSLAAFSFCSHVCFLFDEFLRSWFCLFSVSFSHGQLPRQSFLTVANECGVIAQAEEERQRPSSQGHEGGSETALVQLRAMQRRSDLHAIELVMSPDDRYHPDREPKLYTVNNPLFNVILQCISCSLC